MSGPFGSSQWLYEAGGDFYSYPISNSCRFDGASKLTMTPPSASDRTKFTFSCWVKRSTLADRQRLFEGWGGNSSNWTVIHFHSNDSLEIQNRVSGSIILQYISSAKYRDTSAWYHIVVQFDLGSTGLKAWVNGEEITLWDKSTFSASNTFFNSSSYNINIGYYQGNNNQYLSGYMADAYFVDNQALSATDFGEYDSTGTIWIPKAYSGTYGTNGFHLDFADGTSATTLGYDVSGNSNHFTPSGIATSDQMLDSPTNNFATLSSTIPWPATLPLTEGNLEVYRVSQTPSTIGSSFGVNSGSWYFEARVGQTYSTYSGGLGLTSMEGTVPDGIGTNPISTIMWWMGTQANNGIYINGTRVYTPGIQGSTGDIIGISFDMDVTTNNVKFYRNGTLIYTASKDFSGLNHAPAFACNSNTNPSWTVNFGQDSSFAGRKTGSANATDANGYGDFYYTPPSGHLAICAQNLPAPTFDPAQGESPLDTFNSVLYDGNGTDAHAITGVGFSPDFTWIKARGPNGRYHRLTDTVRGATRSSTTNYDFGEAVDSTHLQSFDADGFTLGTQASFNASGETYVAWNWKLGGSSNTFNIDGTGYSTASAAGLDGGTQNPTGATVNTQAGVGIYTYTGDGTTKTIAHGLGVVPSVVIIKNRSSVAGWFMYTNSIDGSMDYSYLNTTGAFGVSGRALTSTTFDHNASIEQGANGDGYVAWVFAEKEGFSKFGSYVGNASADGTFVYTGFRPAWIMAKPASGAGSWSIVDNKRDGYNPDNDRFLAESNAIEDTTDYVDILSNGFKFRSNTGMNAAYTYFFMAFAEQPFKYSNAR